MEKWTADLIGPQLGKTVIVTGGTDAIGLEIARELARNGAKVIICADDVLKGERAMKDIRSCMQGAQVSFERLDLADLESVRIFTERMLHELDGLDILINNGGIAAVPERLVSNNNFELMFAMNYLSHFAVTARLFPLLKKRHSRVIFQSSLEHHLGLIDFYDLQATHLYDSKKAYSQSKLAQVLFARELERRIRETHLSIRSIAVHPGGARTHFFTKGPRLSKKMIRPKDLLDKMLVFTMGQSAAKGALPALFAATADEAMGGHFYGPDGFYEIRGNPVEVSCSISARNLQAAEKLWEVSEDLTGVEFKLADLSNVIPFQIRGNILAKGWRPKDRPPL